jgi:UDP:flavonoid glycosyltransferase YjiC (YdhE family)
MARIVFIPFPETGHMNPSFKLSKALKARGHQVCYLGIPDFEEYLTGQGLEFIPIFEKLCPRGFIHSRAVGVGRDNFSALLLEARQASEADVIAQTKRELEAVCLNARPDLFVVDLLLPDLAAITSALGVDTILLNTQLYNPWEVFDPSYAPLSDMPEIILCPQEFDFPATGRPTTRTAGRYYAEASIDLERKEDAFAWDRLGPDKLTLFCALGSQAHLIKGNREFFIRVAEAASLMSEWQLILAVGSGFRAEDFDLGFKNVVVVNTAPQVEILKRCDLMITHGGFNSVKECIYFGVPVIVMPSIRDHPAVAARVVYHGLGARGNFKNTSVKELHSLIDSVVGSQLIRRRIELMGQRFREIEGSGVGARLVEEHLRGPHSTEERVESSFHL